MKDRSSDPPHIQPDLDAERERLKGQSTLVILDLLRAELQSLRTFKEEYERELKGEQKRKKSSLELQNDRLRLKLAEYVASTLQFIDTCISKKPMND